jgi:RimJ/RimL family protein N-acetyltransferase
MLIGPKVVLRAWRESDLQSLLELRNNASLQHRLMTQPRPNSLERVKQWLLDKSGREETIFFVIASRADDSVVGYVQLANLKLLHGTGEVGICLAPSAQRKGLGRESFELLETYVRNTFALRKLLLYVFADSDGAIAFYQVCGYSESGRLARHFYSEGEYKDVLIMEKIIAR